MNYLRVWDQKEYAKKQYAEIGVNPWIPGKRADACIECGTCEDKCPQVIAVMDQLKECHQVLGSSAD
jgi:predicted aldo/keto reductase-like oxidoreductase